MLSVYFIQIEWILSPVLKNFHIATLERIPEGSVIHLAFLPYSTFGTVCVDIPLAVHCRFNST